MFIQINCPVSNILTATVFEWFEKSRSKEYHTFFLQISSTKETKVCTCNPTKSLCFIVVRVKHPGFPGLFYNFEPLFVYFLYSVIVIIIKINVIYIFVAPHKHDILLIHDRILIMGFVVEVYFHKCFYFIHPYTSANSVTGLKKVTTDICLLIYYTILILLQIINNSVSSTCAH